MRTLGIFSALVLGMMLLGCGSNVQATRAVVNMEVAAISYSRNMEKIVDAFIKEYKRQALARIDKDHDEAVLSVIRPDNTINAATGMALLKKKLRDYALVEKTVVSMKKKPLEAYKDIEHLTQYSKALQNYFNQKAQTAEILEASTDQMLLLLERFISGEPKKLEALP